MVVGGSQEVAKALAGTLGINDSKSRQSCLDSEHTLGSDTRPEDTETACNEIEEGERAIL